MIYALYRLGYHSRQTMHGFHGLASTGANEQLVEFGKPARAGRQHRFLHCQFGQPPAAGATTFQPAPSAGSARSPEV